MDSEYIMTEQYTDRFYLGHALRKDIVIREAEGREDFNPIQTLQHTAV